MPENVRAIVVPSDRVEGELDGQEGPPPGVRFVDGAVITTRHLDTAPGGGPSTFVWASTVGSTIYDEPLPGPERGYVVEGEGTFTGADGSVQQVSAGSVFVLPAGWSGRFDAVRPVRKIIYL